MGETPWGLRLLAPQVVFDAVTALKHWDTPPRQWLGFQKKDTLKRSFSNTAIFIHLHLTMASY